MMPGMGNAKSKCLFNNNLYSMRLKKGYTLESSTAARLNLNGLTLMSHALILAEQISINLQ